MADKLLQPGWGDKQTMVLLNGADSDVFDMSRCAQFAVQMKAEVGTVSGQLEQSFDGTNWVSLGAAFTVTGTTQKYDITDGPFGLIRMNQTAADGTGTYVLVGWPIPITF